MFEILMLLGFAYAGFCHLAPPPPAKKTAPRGKTIPSPGPGTSPGDRGLAHRRDRLRRTAETFRQRHGDIRICGRSGELRGGFYPGGGHDRRRPA